MSTERPARGAARAVTLRPLPGLAAFAARFDAFLVDQFGVLHDGHAAYPGAAEALARLRDAGKRVALVSNSGKRAAVNTARLARLGFPPDLYDVLVSSGEVAWRLIRDGRVPGVGPGARCHFLERDGDRDAVDGLGLTLVERAEEADVILLSGIEPERHALDHYVRALGAAAARGVPCLCTNPDRRQFVRGGGVAYGPGEVALAYAAAGGPVRWIGKPHADIYEFALASLAVEERARVVGVGDSPEHDIAGAKGAGCAAALVLTGIHAHDDDAEREAWIRSLDAWPDFVLTGFRWDEG